jgi:hypothetical protein
MRDIREEKEEYDVRVPSQYREKGFSRLDKSFMRSKPNHLGLEHIEERAEMVRDKIHSLKRKDY